MLNCRFFPSAAIIASVAGFRSRTTVPGQQQPLYIAARPFLQMRGSPEDYGLFFADNRNDDFEVDLGVK